VRSDERTVFETVILLIVIETLACSNSILYNTLHINNNNNSSSHLRMSAPNPLPFGASRAIMSVPSPQFVA